MIDYRYLYLLRQRGKKVVCVMAVKIPWAAKRERWLHDNFDCSRFTKTRKGGAAPNGLLSLFEAKCKIGITNNLPRRLGKINADKLSGKTEWFTLNWAERLCVRFWMVVWRGQVIVVGLAITLALLWTTV